MIQGPEQGQVFFFFFREFDVVSIIFIIERRRGEVAPTDERVRRIINKIGC